LKAQARTPEVGEVELSLPVSYDGPPLEITFDPSYISDALKALDAEEVVLELKDGECAGLIRDGKSYTYVIMPLTD
jgi:DNA polymerase-3 subunit beta